MKKRTIIGILIFLALIITWSCATYSYVGQAGYDVLDPPEIIRANPIRIVEDGFVVNKEFLFYVKELQLEIKRLRKELK